MASNSIIVISSRQDDMVFGQALARAYKLQLFQVQRVPNVRATLLEKPQSIVFWNGDDQGDLPAIGSSLAELIHPLRVFLVTDKPINKYPEVFKHAPFRHHFIRRYDPTGMSLYSKLAMSVLLPHPFGIEHYFPDNAKLQKIAVKSSDQKAKAVQALQNYFGKLGLPDRLGSAIAAAADELIMNAIFDAPVSSEGHPYRKKLDRNDVFDLMPKEHIDVNVAFSEKYGAISVSDQFGSLKRDVVMDFLKKDFQSQSYKPIKNDPGAGLGLHGVIQAGLSTLFISKPAFRTEVMLFFPVVKTFKEFREGFRFLSINVD